MPLCMILYKVTTNGEESILTNYADKEGLVFVKAGVMPLVRLMERKWRNQSFETAAIDSLYLNPSVIAVESLNDPVRLGIVNDPYIVQLLSVAGVNKLIMAKCEGPNARKYWDKGKKPKLPENPDVSDNSRRATVPTPILAPAEGDVAVPHEPENSQ